MKVLNAFDERCPSLTGETESPSPSRGGYAQKPQFYAAASAAEIADAEDRLNARFPASFRSLLLETNGVMEMMAIDGGEWFDCQWLVWTVANLVEENHYYRNLTRIGTYKRDFHQLVIFANAGVDGILFGFPVMEDRVCASPVVVWNPYGDELDERAPSLEDFLKGWLTGAITV